MASYKRWSHMEVLLYVLCTRLYRTYTKYTYRKDKPAIVKCKSINRSVGSMNKFSTKII